MGKEKLWTMVCAVSVFTGNHPLCETVNIGPFTRLYSETSRPTFPEDIHPVHNPSGHYEIDGSFATMRQPNGEYAFFSSKWNGLRMFMGKSNQPLRTRFPIDFGWNGVPPVYTTWFRRHDQLWPDSPLFRDLRPDTKTPNASAWIPNMYKIAVGEYLGFVHVEDFSQCQPGDPGDGKDLPWNYCRVPLDPKQVPVRQVKYRIGLAYTKNGGLTWNYCGDIITPHVDNGTQSIIGGTPYIIVNLSGTLYFYLYFNETKGRARWSDRRVSVARARFDDVIAAAKNGQVIPWNKMGGTVAAPVWTENGIGGLGADLMEGHTAPGYSYSYTYDTHHDAAFSIGHANKFFMTLSMGNSTETTSDNAMGLFSSPDGINWNSVGILDQTYTNQSFTYSTFVGNVNATDDGFQVGDQFEIHYVVRSGITPSRQSVWSRLITITP